MATVIARLLRVYAGGAGSSVNLRTGIGNDSNKPMAQSHMIYHNSDDR